MSLKHSVATTTILASLVAMAACQASFQASAGSGPTTPSATPAAGGAPAATTTTQATGGSVTQAGGTTSPTTTEAAAPKAKATIGGGRVVPQGTLAFDTARAILLTTSENGAILDDLKILLDQYPNLTQLRIEGYADNAGSADANLELSGQRALAVKKALLDRGVPKERLIAVGFGDKKPKAGQNQRIEFKVAIWDGKNYQNLDPAGGGKKFE
jgi:outer membrane protein OmpA-like peptidoglycan-associated protein